MQRTRRVALVAAMVGLSGCGSLGAHAPPARLQVPAPLISPEEEALLGANLDAVINSETRAAPGALQDYFQTLLDQLVDAAAADRDGMILSVKVLDNPEIGNVFATPSGSIYITSGILLSAADEAEVVAVVAHELGHVVKGHPLARLLRGLGLAQVKSLAVSQSALGRDQQLSGALTSATYALMTGGAQLRYLPEEETEADGRALGYLDREGFDTGALGSFLGSPSKADPNPLSTLHAAHPMSLSRLASMPARHSRKKPRATPALVALKEMVSDRKAENRRQAKKALGKNNSGEPGLDKASARR